MFVAVQHFRPYRPSMNQTSDPITPDFWNRIALDTWNMWFEASQVVWLRSMRLAGGGRVGERESRRMVNEKLAAPWELAFGLVFDPATYGQNGAQHVAGESVRHYGAKVSANRRRLSR